MRKIVLFLFVAILCCVTADGKTTYIPKYRSYIHIVNSTDTIVATSNIKELSLKDKTGMFSILVEHEDVTKEKVKAIKRAKRAAGWATVSAVMSGVSTAFSNNSLQYMVRSTNTKFASQLAEIYNENAKAEEKLKIDMWVDNTSDEELLVNDMERGLTWYVLPRQSLHILLNNPDATLLRISDLRNNAIRYVSAMAGNMIYKGLVGWEDDDCWIISVYNNYDYENIRFDKYKWISKSDFSEREMTKEEFRAFTKDKK